MGAVSTITNDVAGIGSRTVSEQARRLIVLAGTSWSFQKASDKLLEFCRLKVSNDTVRAVCDEEGQKVGRWIAGDKASTTSIRQASGELEFSSDGTCVNTTSGHVVQAHKRFAKTPPELSREARFFDTISLTAVLPPRCG